LAGLAKRVEILIILVEMKKEEIPGVLKFYEVNRGKL